MTEMVLITGGAGSLGRMLTERFASAGYLVRIFDLPAMDFSGLEDRSEIQIFRGDITDRESVSEAVAGVDAVVHLAALLPPRAEQNRDLTMAVNLGGTRTILEAMESGSPGGRLVFASSVSTYGDTSGDNPPVTPDHPQRATDIYAESKIAAESVIKESRVNSVILRIAPIAVPAFLEPPDVWPFTSGQRVEMVHRDDVVDAIFNAVSADAAVGKALNIAGGPTWQLDGKRYVEDFYDFVGAPSDDATYRTTPGWVDWYDTSDSQPILGFQNRSYQHYSQEMRDLVAELMEG